MDRPTVKSGGFMESIRRKYAARIRDQRDPNRAARRAGKSRHPRRAEFHPPAGLKYGEVHGQLGQRPHCCDRKATQRPKLRLRAERRAANKRARAARKANR